MLQRNLTNKLRQRRRSETTIIMAIIKSSHLGYGEPLMGFWPYFLHAQESDGGAPSPLSRDPSGSLIGIEITLFCNDLLLDTAWTCTVRLDQRRRKNSWCLHSSCISVSFFFNYSTLWQKLYIIVHSLIVWYNKTEFSNSSPPLPSCSHWIWDLQPVHTRDSRYDRYAFREYFTCNLTSHTCQI